jgi:predicted ATP-dependent protease
VPLEEAIRLRPEALRWSVDLGEVGFSTTAELAKADGVHAQSRALEAMRLATEVRAPGYNVFCLGLSGANRMQVLRDAVARLGPRGRPSPDRCYVMSFRQPESPRLLELPRGTARAFQRDVDDLIDQLVKHLGLVFEEDRFAGRVREITERHQTQEREILNRLHDLARESGFTVAEVEGENGTSVDLLYRVAHQQLSLPDLERAAKDARAGIVPEVTEDEEQNEAIAAALRDLDVARVRAGYDGLSEMLRKSMVEARRIARSMHRQIQALEREEGLVVVEGAVQELASRYAGVPGVRAHLDELRGDVLDRVYLFKRGGKPGESGDADGEEDTPDPRRDAYLRYRVNVVLDNTGRDECPIIVESNPTARNLFGTIISNLDRFGRPSVDHRSIRPGSLLCADGGYLLLDASNLMTEPETWRTLERVLLEERLDLRDAVSERGQPAGLVLRPEPIPVDVKVLMVGQHDVYEMLDSVDADFKHVFKIRAEFDWLMDRSPDNVLAIGRSVASLCEEEKLPPFRADAVAALAEHAARLAEHPGRMISAFDQLAEPARQAAVAAMREGSDVVRESHVRRALAAADRRCSLGAERVHQAIHEKRIIINSTGDRVGQVNGLAVVSTIEHAFGYPVRITAVVSHGTAGVLNVEREVRLSGSLHDKGMFIVAGYLANMYGREFPLVFSASVAFEQLYGGIEGDSASSAEIFALLSALSGVPLRQGIGVTGSVNQVGEIQPVGGVNEKIEGFYDACAGLAGGAERMPGGQGVLMPRANVGDLMLRDDILDAARAGRFAVWAMDTVDQGLELLTGLPVGEPDEGGRYPKGSVHCAVHDRLRALSQSAGPAAGLAGGPSSVRYREKPAPKAGPPPSGGASVSRDATVDRGNQPVPPRDSATSGRSARAPSRDASVDRGNQPVPPRDSATSGRSARAPSRDARVSRPRRRR